MLSTKALLAKSFCWNRELVWSIKDDRPPRINPDEVSRLLEDLNKRPIAEIQRAAMELGINVSYDC